MSEINDAAPIMTPVSKDAGNLFTVGTDDRLHIEDAPADGKQYTRQNGQWVELSYD